MKITKLTFTLLLLTFGLNLQAQEGVTKRKPQPIYKAPNGKAFPANWGRPPLRQTRDLRPLPGGYGRGSGTLVGWIQENIDKDANKNKRAIKPKATKKAFLLANSVIVSPLQLPDLIHIHRMKMFING